jgi:hypothetical protein
MTLVPAFSPRAFDAKSIQVLALAFIEVVLDEAVNAAAAGAAPETLPQFGQVFGAPRSYHYDVADLGVPHPAAEIEFTGLAMNEPAEAHALHTTLNEKV